MCVPSCQALRAWGCEPAEVGLTAYHMEVTHCTKRLERRTRAGESPVVQRVNPMLPPLKYHRTREIRWEAGPTTVQG
jgi:hypothetical protein